MTALYQHLSLSCSLPGTISERLSISTTIRNPSCDFLFPPLLDEIFRCNASTVTERLPSRFLVNRRVRTRQKTKSPKFHAEPSVSPNWTVRDRLCWRRLHVVIERGSGRTAREEEITKSRNDVGKCKTDARET